jgi:signal transduction histidine kinase
MLDDPGLSAALAAAARLAAANARLQAEVHAQVVELQASRRRLVQAGDEERSRIERRLRDTVERRLGGLARMLERAPPARAAEQLARTRDELRELAAGLHPGGLEQGTLADALASLASRSPVPVVVSAPSAALPDEVAVAAYFVCSEALANVVKYAAASRVAIAVSVGDGTVRVAIADDGAGGADPAAGSGLRGLADRLDALGGTLAIDSPRGGGTRVTAELPLGDPPR